MCINKNNCNCLSTPRECDSLGPFIAIDINCINTPVDNNAGSIIPFSSGITTSVVSRGPDFGFTSSLIGFGTAINGVTILNDNTINLTGSLSEAFSVPRNSNITAISAAFSAIPNPNLIEVATITAQIYRAPAGSNIFTATNARVDLAPPVTNFVQPTSFGSAEIEPVSVSVGDLLLMVFYISSTIISPQTNFSISGFASAGINMI
ncbi:exosporium glycoprotein BclB-related protein [Lysinibacillus sp. NPDC048646]|uniref:exosporium glycoprotein BclB-related protein n=1 Tax=Lysinibacillus sp. NPDC048646 TaxID=3390574 RepID=UPI003D022B2F